MEHRSGRIETQIVVRDNTRSSPLLSIKIDLQHVIRHVLSKAKLFIRNLGLGILGAFNNDLRLLRITTIHKHLQQRKKLGGDYHSLHVIDLHHLALSIKFLEEATNAMITKEINGESYFPLRSFNGEIEKGISWLSSYMRKSYVFTHSFILLLRNHRSAKKDVTRTSWNSSILVTTVTKPRIYPPNLSISTSQWTR